VFAPSSGVFSTAGLNTTTPVHNPAGDSLEILGGTATSVEHRLANASDGSVRYNGSGTDNISYTGLEPIDDTIDAERIFSVPGTTKCRNRMRSRSPMTGMFPDIR
jgi:hypothetical protein